MLFLAVLHNGKCELIFCSLWLSEEDNKQPLLTSDQTTIFRSLDKSRQLASTRCKRTISICSFVDSGRVWSTSWNVIHQSFRKDDSRNSSSVSQKLTLSKNSICYLTNLTMTYNKSNAVPPKNQIYGKDNLPSSYNFFKTGKQPFKKFLRGTQIDSTHAG